MIAKQCSRIENIFLSFKFKNNQVLKILLSSCVLHSPEKKKVLKSENYMGFKTIPQRTLHSYVSKGGGQALKRNPSLV